MKQHTKTAQAIVDAWTQLSERSLSDMSDAIATTVIEYKGAGEIDAGREHLVRRLLFPPVTQAILDIFKLLADGNDAVSRVQQLLAPGERNMLSRFAATVLPEDTASRKRMLEEFEGSVEWLWSPNLDGIIQLLTRHVWTASVEPLIGDSAPALPIEIVRPLAKLLSGECYFSALRGGAWSIRHRNDDLGVIRVDPVVGSPRRTKFHDNLAPTDFEILGSTSAHRLLRELVARGWELSRRKDSEPGRVVIPGGWPALARDLGVASADGRDRLRRAARVLSLVELRPDEGTPASLLRVLGSRGSRTRVDDESVVEFRLLNELLPGAVVRKRKGSDRSLVPLPVVLPRVVGTKLMARAFSYQMLLLFEMRKRAVDFDQDRFLVIPIAKRRSFARDVGLSDMNRSTIERGWLVSDQVGFLEQGADATFRLTTAYESIDRFLVGARARSIRGQLQRARVRAVR